MSPTYLFAENATGCHPHIYLQKTPLDVRYFDTAFTDEPVKLTPVDRSLIGRLDQRQFKGFSYTNRLYTAGGGRSKQS